jgi:hypothetical protein
MLLPTKVLADQPITQTIPLDVTYSQPANTNVNPCSFPVTIREVGTLYLKEYVDQNGQTVGLLVRTPQIEWTFTGPNGTALSSRSPAPTRYDGPPSRYVVYVTGMELDFHSPGTGTLFKIAGRYSISFDFTTTPPTITGPQFTGKITGDTTEFCTLLSS